MLQDLPGFHEKTAEKAYSLPSRPRFPHYARTKSSPRRSAKKDEDLAASVIRLPSINGQLLQLIQQAPQVAVLHTF